MQSRYNHGGFDIETDRHTYITPWSIIYDLRSNKTASAFIHCYLRAWHLISISHDPAAFKQPTKSKAAPLSELHSSYPQAPEFQCQPPKRQSSKRQTISPSSSLRKMHCEPSDPAAFSLVFCFSPNTLHRSTHLYSARSQIVPSLLNQIPLSLPPPLLASHLTPMSSLSI